MVSRIFVGLGILLMLFAVYFGWKLLSIIHDEIKRTAWYILFLLIIFFLFGYIVYFYLLFTSVNSTDVTALLISAVFFFGAVFVVMVLSVNNSLVSGLNENAQKLGEANTRLKQSSEVLQQKDKELEEAKVKLEHKNKELEKALEDFYTLRIGMARDMEAGRLEEENKMIKERLDKLKGSS